MTIEQIHAFGGIVLLAASFGIIIYFMRLRHIEKLEMIKKGDMAFAPNYMENLRYSILSKAVVMIALAVGLGVGYAINLHITDNNSQGVVYLICLLASGGLGLLVFYLIIQNKDK
ncbi:MAG TPA: DUF6249 domain-containing protein [Puia sp.]|nr:DUF6249 domain-containing protein [Puia sp.]